MPCRELGAGRDVGAGVQGQAVPRHKHAVLGGHLAHHFTNEPNAILDFLLRMSRETGVEAFPN